MKHQRSLFSRTVAGLALSCVLSPLSAAPPQQPAADAGAAPASAAATAELKLRFRVTPTLLKAALARDEGLGNALAFFVRQGVALSPTDGIRQGRLIFQPRPADALAAFIDDPSRRFPDAAGSATPAIASGAVYRLEAAPGGGQRLRVGLDDAVQAAAQPVVTPARWFELSVAEGAQELTLLAWRPLTAP